MLIFTELTFSFLCLVSNPFCQDCWCRSKFIQMKICRLQIFLDVNWKFVAHCEVLVPRIPNPVCGRIQLRWAHDWPKLAVFVNYMAKPAHIFPTDTKWWYLMTVKWNTNQQLKHNIIILLAIKLLRQQVTSVRYFREEWGGGGEVHPAYAIFTQ